MARTPRVYSRVPVALAAVLWITASLMPAAAVAADSASTQRSDATEGSSVDLTQVVISQRLHELTFVATTAQPVTPALLAADTGGGLCFTLDPNRGRQVRLCAEGEGDRLTLRRNGRKVHGQASMPTATQIELKISDSALNLRPGPIKWSVTGDTAGCVVTTSPVPCADRAPDVGEFHGRLWRAAVTGCQETTRGKVSQGPRVKRVALTYDDGPSAYTPSFIRVLERFRVPATFFMIGEQVHGHGAQLMRELADGDELGNHSWNHAFLGHGGPQAGRQLEMTQRAIAKTSGGYLPCVFRPPYGATSADLESRAKALGLATILWSVDPTDWATPGAGTIADRVLAQTGPGAIILDHDGGGNRSQTLAAAPTIIRTLKRRGYKFVTVGDLLNFKPRLELKR